MTSPSKWGLHALREASAGRSAPVEFLAPEAGEAHPQYVLREDIRHPSPLTAVVRTSGSTGTPKQTLLTAAAMKASAHATAEHLGGHGQWLLTLHPSYVAGLAVLTRSLAAGTTPVTLLEHTTDPEAFTAAAEQLTEQRRYVSLVPTQLQRLIDAASSGSHPRLLTALQRFDAILLGGGASSPSLLTAAEQAGLTVIRTYGMSETCGGCIYDGIPLPGVTMEIDDDARVLLSGPMVASGYLNDSAHTAAVFDHHPVTGHPRFRTDDLGSITEGVLSLSGRADDVINTGGVKVSAEQIRHVLTEHPQISEAFVGGVQDREWGQRVVAVVVNSAPHTGPSFGETTLPEDQPDTLPASLPEALREEIAERVRTELGSAAVPKEYLVLAALPKLANGKPDRQQLMSMLESAGVQQREGAHTTWQH